MTAAATSTTLLPIRDRRDRVVGYVVSSCPAQERAGGFEFRTRCADVGIAAHVLSAANSDAWRDARDELGFSRSELS